MKTILLFFICSQLICCATDDAGKKTFLGLNGTQWASVGIAGGKGAVAGALPAYQAAKTPATGK